MILENIRLYTGNAFYPKATLVARDARVFYAGDADDAPDALPFEEKIDGGDGICLPGLVNAHTHAGMSLLRGVGSDLTLMDWLAQIEPIEARLTPARTYDGTMLAVLEMLRTGTTAFADMYCKMDGAFQAALDSGMRANLSRGSSDREGVESHIAWAKQYHGADDSRLRVSMGIHACYSAPPDVVSYAVETARELGLRVHVHVSETRWEVQNCLERYGKTPGMHLDALGAFDMGAIAAHGVYLTDEERALFARKGVYVAHCPASNLKLASGVFDLIRAQDAGVPVCLGTDGAASNNALDMFREMYLCAMLPKGVRLDPTRPTARESLAVATRNGALALGFDDAGLLEEGMRADFALLSGDSVSLLPGADPVSDLVYAAQGALVRMTAVNGKILYRDGKYPYLDEEAIRARGRETARALGVIA